MSPTPAPDRPVSTPGRRPVALVTGATAGIGRAFCDALAERGHDLVLVARDETRLAQVAEQLAATHGVEVHTLAADLADRTQLARVEQRLTAGTPIDLLVNNAGFGLKQPFLDNDVEAEQQLLDVLVTAVMRLTHAALKPMLERGHGGVINVSSVAAFVPRGTYSAAKAYVNQFSRWADLTYRDRGVRTMALCPGFTRTEFHERMQVGRDSAPRWMWLDVEDLVQDALRDYDAGKTISVPSRRYRAVVAAARLTPARLQAKFQRLGR